jgi:hypothetical protein
MHTTRIIDLNHQLRLHVPYLYCHNKGCEHIISFVDVRFITPTTSTSSPLTATTAAAATPPPVAPVAPVAAAAAATTTTTTTTTSSNRFSSSTKQHVSSISKWPVELYRRPLIQKRCSVCSPPTINNKYIKTFANFVLYDHGWTDSSPLFMCERCYDLFHYDEKGMLLYDTFKVFPYYHEL